MQRYGVPLVVGRSPIPIPLPFVVDNKPHDISNRCGRWLRATGAILSERPHAQPSTGPSVPHASGRAPRPVARGTRARLHMLGPAVLALVDSFLVQAPVRAARELCLPRPHQGAHRASDLVVPRSTSPPCLLPSSCLSAASLRSCSPSDHPAACRSGRPMQRRRRTGVLRRARLRPPVPPPRRSATTCPTAWRAPPWTCRTSSRWRSSRQSAPT